MLPMQTKLPTQAKQLLAALCLVASPALVWSASARDQLHQFVANVESATGEFSQQTLAAPNSPKRAKPPESGHFAFRRPGRFRWEGKNPYEQLIVSTSEERPVGKECVSTCRTRR